MKQDDWQQRLVHTIAAEVRRHRLARKMSAQKLAGRCREVGLAIPRSVITNLENGYRESVSVAELLVLAAALEVSPLELVIPVGRAMTLEILPGVHAPTWESALWWRGEGYGFADLGDGPVLVRNAERRGAVDWILDHQARVLDLQRIMQVLRYLTRTPGASSEQIENLYDRQLGYEAEIGRLRDAMRSAGLIPPPLSSDLAQRIDPTPASDAR